VSALPAAPPPPLPFPERRKTPRKSREIYIDAFRGLVALVMVQGHVFDALLSPLAIAHPLYQLQLQLHGSTAPGFLFASGFVAGLPRAPLSLKASLRRARRLLFVLGVGYALHLPFFSIWKTLNEATPLERAALFACDALQVIAVTQLLLLFLQWMVGRRWVVTAAILAVAVLVAGPFVWSSGLSLRLPLWLGAYFDMTAAPSRFPLFPFAAFVLAGTVAGAALGRQDPVKRHRRAWIAGGVLIAVGLVLTVVLAGRVHFWSISPAYALLRLGALVLLLRLVEMAAARGLPGVRGLALLGHETLLVYVLHLLILYGGVIGRSPVLEIFGTLSFVQAGVVLVLMVPLLFAASWAWHRLKEKAPHEASLVLVFLAVLFVHELLTRPW
jgi:uncharacterized membrane protein